MKRKTRKAKIQAQKRKIQKLTELKELKQKAQFLQEQIAKQKKQYLKNFQTNYEVDEAVKAEDFINARIKKL